MGKETETQFVREKDQARSYQYTWPSHTLSPNRQQRGQRKVIQYILLAAIMFHFGPEINLLSVNSKYREQSADCISQIGHFCQDSSLLVENRK